MTKRGSKPFSQVLTDLATARHPAKDDLCALSDLSGERLVEFKRRWSSLPADKRLAIMTALSELDEETFEVNIHPASRAALNDPDPRVRAHAIRNLWEDQGLDLVDPFLKFLAADPAAEVRTAAATALGIYIYLGEMEELPAAQLQQLEDALLAVYHGPDTLEVRRRALESLGFSRRPEAAAALDQAYGEGDDLLRVSALFAMGRSLDPERWSDMVLDDLQHANLEVRFEAARAAGELQLDEAAPILDRLIDAESDTDIREICIWALGEIGGDEARRILEARLETADEEFSKIIEDALAEANLMDGLLDFGALDFNEDEDEQARKARLN